MTAPPLPVAKGEEILSLLPGMANRHGLVAGATGTGKTVTLRVLAERLQPHRRAGLPGRREGGPLRPRRGRRRARRALVERAKQLGARPLEPAGRPVVFWDVFGEQGHPLRTTVSEMGPLLLSRVLDLNDVQDGVLPLAFKIADDEGLLLLDLKDLRAILAHVAEAPASCGPHGNVSAASVGAIQRQLLALEQQGGDRLFGEPALDLADLLRTDAHGRGDRRTSSPPTSCCRRPGSTPPSCSGCSPSSTSSCPRWATRRSPGWSSSSTRPTCSSATRRRSLLEKVEQVVRLIRSKGVGVYFVTQNPLDVPDTVLGQLGNRVQHALRAFTPRDQKAVRAAAETFRAEPRGSTCATAITELEVGEALVSFLDAQGHPHPGGAGLRPAAPVAPRAAHARRARPGDAASPVRGKYDQAVDRESAYERLQARAAERGGEAASPGRSRSRTAEPRSEVADTLSSMAKSVARSAGTQIGRELIRGLMGVFGTKNRR